MVQIINKKFSAIQVGFFIDTLNYQYFKKCNIPDSTEAKHMRSRHDFKIPVLGCSAQAAQLQQKVFRDLERIFLLEPGQPLPFRRGQGGVGQEVRHHCVTGKVSIIIHYTINPNCGCTS